MSCPPQPDSTDPLVHGTLNPLPFRTEPRQASPADVKAANKHEGLRGASAYCDAPIAIQQIQTIKSPSINRLRSWAYHPDERVAIALASNSQLLGASRATHRGTIRAILYHRAMNDALAEGVLWTPLLDALAVGHAWPASFEYDQFIRSDEARARKLVPVPFIPSREAVTRLLSWLRQERDPRRIEKALTFQDSSLVSLVALYASTVDRQLLDAFLAWQKGTVAARLLSNSAFDDELKSVLIEWAIQDINRYDPEWERTKRFSPGASVLAAYLRQGGHLDNLQIQRIATALEHPAGSDNHVWAGLPRTDALSVLKPLVNRLNAYQLCRMIEASSLSFSILELLKAPNADASVWLTGLRRFHQTEVRIVVAQIPAACQHPKIVLHLLRSRSIDVYFALLESCAPRYFPQIVQWLSDAQTIDALKIIEKRIAGGESTIEPHHLMPFLKHRDQEVRLRAIMLLGRLQQLPAQTQQQDSQRPAATPGAGALAVAS